MPSDATKSLILRDEEVRAVLAGRATVRRPVNWPVTGPWIGNKRAVFGPADVGGERLTRACPLGAAGERRSVREAWRPWATPVVYRADQSDECVNLHYPATHMKASESRLTVQIVAVRVERGANGWEWVVEIERCANG